MIAKSTAPASNPPTAARYARQVHWRIHILTALILLAALVGFSVFAMQAFENRLAPELGKKSATIGRILTAQIERAVGYGIPFARLVGMDSFLDSVLQDNPEVAYLLVTDASGSILYSAGSRADQGRAALTGFNPALLAATDPAQTRSVGGYYDTHLPIKNDNRLIGVAHIGVRQDFVRGQHIEIADDLLTVLAIVLLLAFEIMAVLLALRVAQPAAQAKRLLDRLRRGDFRYSSGAANSGEVGRFITALTAVNRRVNEQYRRLVQEAVEIRAGQIDPRIIAQIDAVMDRVKTRFTLLAPGAPPIILREPSLAAIRGPLFLFVFAEELSRAFMPLYAQQLYRLNPTAILGLSEEFVIGLPIAIFMLCIAIATPFAGSWTERWGTRRLFIAAMAPALAGAIGAALAESLWTLLLSRSLSAIGYAIATVACQGYIAQTAADGGRARAMAALVSSILAASICGAAIGGVLADRIGYRSTFLIAAGLIPLAALLWLALIDEPARALQPAADTGEKRGWRTVPALLRNPRFVALICGSAIPAKMILTGFLFFLTPLYLQRLGYNTATSGRVIGCYFVLMFLLDPIAARWTDRVDRHRTLIIVGGLLSGAGLFSALYWNTLWAVLVGVLALGLGQAVLTAPTAALIPKICERECAQFGQTAIFRALRVMENIGAALGPVLAAWMIGYGGYAGSAVGNGLVAIIGATLLGLTWLALGDGRRTAKAADAS